MYSFIRSPSSNFLSFVSFYPIPFHSVSSCIQSSSSQSVKHSLVHPSHVTSFSSFRCISLHLNSFQSQVTPVLLIQLPQLLHPPIRTCIRFIRLFHSFRLVLFHSLQIISFHSIPSIRSFISFIHPSIHPSIHLSILSFISFISFMHPFIRSFIHLFIPAHPFDFMSFMPSLRFNSFQVNHRFMHSLRHASIRFNPIHFMPFYVISCHSFLLSSHHLIHTFIRLFLFIISFIHALVHNFFSSSRAKCSQVIHSYH